MKDFKGIEQIDKDVKFAKLMQEKLNETKNGLNQAVQFDIKNLLIIEAHREKIGNYIKEALKYAEEAKRILNEKETERTDDATALVGKEREEGCYIFQEKDKLDKAVEEYRHGILNEKLEEKMNPEKYRKRILNKKVQEILLGAEKPKSNGTYGLLDPDLKLPEV